MSIIILILHMRGSKIQRYSDVLKAPQLFAGKTWVQPYFTTSKTGIFIDILRSRENTDSSLELILFKLILRNPAFINDHSL